MLAEGQRHHLYKCLLDRKKKTNYLNNKRGVVSDTEFKGILLRFNERSAHSGWTLYFSLKYYVLKVRKSKVEIWEWVYIVLYRQERIEIAWKRNKRKAKRKALRKRNKLYSWEIPKSVWRKVPDNTPVCFQRSCVRMRRTLRCGSPSRVFIVKMKFCSSMCLTYSLQYPLPSFSLSF